jgi:hypothetical protein
MNRNIFNNEIKCFCHLKIGILIFEDVIIFYARVFHLKGNTVQSVICLHSAVERERRRREGRCCSYANSSS